MRISNILVALLIGSGGITIGEACTQTCNGFSPNNCLNTITSFSGSGFSTSGLSSQVSLSCGSGDSNLNDRVFQFAVTTSGLYQFNTFNIGSSDTVLQVMTCDREVVGCNNDRSSGDKTSTLDVPLSSGTQYVAVVSKFSSQNSEPTFGMNLNPLCQCSAVTPDACFGTVGTSGLVRTGLTTANSNGKLKMECGSQENGLKDFTFQFQVSTTGTYAIRTENIGSFDTTLSVLTCGDGNVVGCNDDRSSNDKSSEVIVTLQSGEKYVGAVSKRDSTEQEPTFNISIKPATLTPSQAPSKRAATSAPTFAPSQAPTKSTKSPTTATQSPTTATQSPTTATQSPTTATRSPTTATQSPTTTTQPPTQFIQPTTSPTVVEIDNNNTAGATPEEQNNANSDNAVIIGGGVGGALLVALGLAVRRRTLRRKQLLAHRDSWSPEEEALLRDVYRTTHDFDVLCGTFPQKSRESIALRVRDILESESRLGRVGAAMLIAPPQSEKFAFVKAEPPVTSVAASVRTEPSKQSIASRVSSTVSNSVARFGSAVAHSFLPPPPGLSRPSRPLTARNPMFTSQVEDFPPPPPPDF